MLLDTSGLLCCFDADESRHAAAVQFYDQSPVRLTHNYVLAELVAVAQARNLPRDESLAFAADVLADPEIEVVWVDPVLHEEAMKLLQSQLDKSYWPCRITTTPCCLQGNASTTACGFLRIIRQGQSYSLCDAASFVWMRQRGIIHALTTDHHFEHAGFRRLLPR